MGNSDVSKSWAVTAGLTGTTKWSIGDKLKKEEIKTVFDSKYHLFAVNRAIQSWPKILAPLHFFQITHNFLEK